MLYSLLKEEAVVVEEVAAEGVVVADSDWQQQVLHTPPWHITLTIALTTGQHQYNTGNNVQLHQTPNTTPGIKH